MRLLILGGTTEASAIARRISERADLAPILSFAGRTSPVPPPIPFRVGGFGGIEGLKSFLLETKTQAVIDATHPFAVQMSRHAAVACGDLAVPLARFTRPAWQRREGDRWVCVTDMAAAVRALGAAPKRVFLTIGGLQLAVFADATHHHYTIRTIEPPATVLPPSHRLILARGPFDLDDEIRLLRDEQIDILVTKNSGGTATGAKINAARTLGVTVIMIERPAAEEVETFDTADAVLAWIDRHRSAS